jgi:hypothetical protein
VIKRGIAAGLFAIAVTNALAQSQRQSRKDFVSYAMQLRVKASRLFTDRRNGCLRLEVRRFLLRSGRSLDEVQRQQHVRATARPELDFRAQPTRAARASDEHLPRIGAKLSPGLRHPDLCALCSEPAP